jgi:hypothetical protein
MARGSPKAQVEAARKDKKRHDPKRPHWKRADTVKAYAAFAARYQFQDAGHADRKPVNHQCGYDHGATPAKVLLTKIIGPDLFLKNIRPRRETPRRRKMFSSCRVS